MRRMPIILRSGNSEGMIKSDFSRVVNRKLRREKVRFLFLIYAYIAMTTIAASNEINRINFDNGWAYPRASDAEFMIRPNITEKATLRPSDKTIFSTVPSVFSLRNVKMR